MTRPAAGSEPGLRIVTQYWRGDVRVCELENAGNTLDVHISRCDGQDDREWIVEVRNGRTDAAVCVSERGTTRATALVAAASAWVARGPALGLRSWDWDAVARALKAVDAID
ncbi:MAG TPA: hypothetical protein VGK73_12280 [Polyangiaceae bacterium]